MSLNAFERQAAMCNVNGKILALIKKETQFN